MDHVADIEEIMDVVWFSVSWETIGCEFGSGSAQFYAWIKLVRNFMSLCIICHTSL